MKKQFICVLLLVFLTVLVGCSNNIGYGSSNGSTGIPPASVSSDLPSSPGAMAKKFSQALLIDNDVEWFVKYAKEAGKRDPQFKNRPQPTDAEIRGTWAFLHSQKPSKAAARTFDITRESINGSQATVTLTVSRVDGTSDSMNLTLKKIDGMWIITP